MKEHCHISMIYGILLAIGILLCIGSLVFIPTVTYTANDKTAQNQLMPTDIKSQNEDVREFTFRGVDWETKGNYLHFISSHQEIRVEADGKLIFEREAVSTIWGRTPGFAWEYIEIPVSTEEVTVTVKACYPGVRSKAMIFYQGFGIQLLQDVFRQEGITAITAFINLCLGFLLLLYGTVTRKRTDIGSVMVYLGILTALLGIWSITENGVTAILFHKRAACSFISYTALALIGIPFIMFIRCYLQTGDKYVHKILLGLNILNILLLFSLQVLGIADMKQLLWLTHICMVLSFFYLPFSLISMLRKRSINRSFWVTVSSLCIMLPPLAYSLYLYYRGSHNVDSYGNVFFFIFIMVFAVDVSLSIIKDIDAGKEAAIYQELAEKDLLTGCYNRNAYHKDADIWTDLHDVLLVTCDLNNLKQCNDTLGHACGDRYITDSAAILKKIFSQYGKVYRIGGDEFCMIIPNGKNCNIEKLLAALAEEARLYNISSPDIHMQIACGHARFDETTDSNMEDIRSRADEQMYENKKELKKSHPSHTP